jgi:hypothetical protein
MIIHFRPLFEADHNSDGELKSSRNRFFLQANGRIFSSRISETAGRKMREDEAGFHVSFKAL